MEDVYYNQPAPKGWLISLVCFWQGRHARLALASIVQREPVQASISATWPLCSWAQHNANQWERLADLLTMSQLFPLVVEMPLWSWCFLRAIISAYFMHTPRSQSRCLFPNFLVPSFLVLSLPDSRWVIPTKWITKFTAHQFPTDKNWAISHT